MKIDDRNTSHLLWRSAAALTAPSRRVRRDHYARRLTVESYQNQLEESSSLLLLLVFTPCCVIYIHILVVVIEHRTTFTSDQLDQMEKLFEHSQYPDFQQRASLSRRTSLSDNRIQVSTGVCRCVWGWLKSALCLIVEFKRRFNQLS